MDLANLKFVAECKLRAWHRRDPGTDDPNVIIRARDAIELAEEVEHLRETARLAERFARAKGRHHSQQAMCDLLDHFGLPCVRPGEETEMATCGCGDRFPTDSYSAGFMDANGGVCENCAAAGGGGDD